MLHCSNTATCELFCFFFSVLVLCRSISFLFYWVEICVRVVWLIIYLTLFYVNDLSYQGTVCRRWTYFDICDLMSLSKFYVYIWVQFPFPSTYLSLSLRWRTALVKTVTCPGLQKERSQGKIEQKSNCIEFQLRSLLFT